MKYCCETCKHELETCPSVSAYMGDCDGWEQKPITNADYIRAMTDEELANLLHSVEEHLFTGNLWNYDKWTEWLKKETKDEKHCQ